MSKLCFSFPADVPAGFPDRSAAQAARRDLRRMPYSCYSYPSMSYSYPDYVAQGGRDPGTAQPSRPGLRGMPMTCFRY